MNILNAIKNTQTNVSYTENGMRGFKTTLHPLLDMNFRLPSYRAGKSELLADLETVMKSNDAEYILKYMFYLRDVRQGLGERDTFRTMLKALATKYDFENKKEIIVKLITKDIEEYGRFDDLFALFDTKYEGIVLSKIKEQLSQDFDNSKKSKSISLLAKWMPSENTSSAETRRLAHRIIKYLKCSPKEYRKLLSTLRAYLKVVEVMTSSNNWGAIDYNTVPSNANLKYKDAFLKHDEERRRDYLAALRIGKDKDGKTVKINSSVNYPHQIVNQYAKSNGWGCRLGSYDEAIEQMWKALPKKDGLADTIVVRDGSGSMTSYVPNSTVSALDVSSALAIYCAEQMNGAFKNHFITFSHTAKLVDLSSYTSLHDKLARAYQESECSNTNIENVFELILRAAIYNKLTQEDMPKQVLIISDMEFDASDFGGNINVFERMAELYEKAGFVLPKLVFWNVNSRTNTVPTLVNKTGVIYVSGFSVNIVDMVMSGKTDPFEVLVEKLSVARYADIPLLTVKNEAVEAKKETKTKLDTKPAWL